jgi:3'-phosphoadenosine 5'-phosphosulfate sulfotransferase (PAPS reductase)/FAD synthetase
MIQYIQQRIDKSRAIIKQMLLLSDNPYLALSFGKDSLVMLDLVREQYPDIPCLFLKSEETFLLHEYEDMILYYQNLGVNIEVVEMKHMNYDFEGGVNNEFTQDAFFRNWDGVFIGLRIEESKARRISLLMKANNQLGYRIMKYKTGKRKDMYRCCPVSDWSAFEIMLYLKEKSIKLLSVYTDENIRTSAQMNYSNNLICQMASLKQRDISRYNSIINQIPELSFSYARN